LTEGVDDEDEVLLALATSLGKMIDKVGGKSYAHTLLPPLELLLMVEEITVRDAASAATQTISDSLPDETFQNQYAAMLKRLATKEWFTARISSAGLMAKAYPRLTSTQQEEHIQLFSKLCQDDTPMVRRVSAQYLGTMLENVVQAVGRKSLEEEGVAAKLLIPLYEELASNEQPVRFASVIAGENEETCFQHHFLADNCSHLFHPGLCSPTNYRELCLIRSGDWRVGCV
jgi:serine/threonine-protein phosphatase 2A regulatory subunit A